MRETAVSWQTHDGVAIVGRCWHPEGPARLALCVTHGLGEHGARYAEMAAALTEIGCAVLAPDLRGHGRSGGPRGHAPSFAALLDDMDLALRQTAMRCPDVPLFLFGHSMGGCIALNYLLRRRPALAGAVITSPALRTALPPPAWKVLLGRLAYHLLPTLSMDNGVALEACAHDPALLRAYRADPLAHTRVSARLGIDLLDHGGWVLAHAADLSLPLLCMQGEADTVTSVAATRAFVAAARGDVTAHFWPDALHELHSEPNRAAIFACIADWLRAHLPA